MVFVVKKSIFIKNQEASGLLRKLGVRTPLINTPLTVDILFSNSCFVLTIFEGISLK